jgi:hypothetical protein
MDASGRLSVASSIEFVEDIPGSSLVPVSRWNLGSREPISIEWLLATATNPSNARDTAATDQIPPPQAPPAEDDARSSIATLDNDQTEPGRLPRSENSAHLPPALRNHITAESSISNTENPPAKIRQN